MSTLGNLDKAETQGNDLQKNADKTAVNNGNTMESKKDTTEATDQKSISTVLQFKIILKDSRPPIWRRIQVPKDFNFAQFHRAISRAMGWGGYHLHLFKFPGPRGRSCITISPRTDDSSGEEEEELNEEEEKLSDYFPGEKTVEHEYDFGNCWEHKIVFEGEMPEKEGETYPKCIGGRRACPPEDCGGVGGYEDLCKIMRNPQHEEYEETKSWLENMDIKRFDPAKFDPESVTF